MTELGPIVEERPHTVLFGKVEGQERGPNPMDPPRRRNDGLFWLRDDTRQSEEVLSHLRSENAFTKSCTGHLQPFTDKLYSEHVAHLKETDSSAPVVDGPFRYYHRNVQGLSYRIYCRDAGAGTAEEVLLDVNELAKGKSHCDVSEVDACPHSPTLLAYSIDTTGDEVYDIVIVRNGGGGGSGEATEERLVATDGSIAWGGDAATLFYVTKDAVKRSHKVWLHVLGTSQAEQDVCLMTEDDELFSIGCGRSRHGGHLLVCSGSSETTEWHRLDFGEVASVLAKHGGKPQGAAAELQALLTPIRARVEGVRYSVDLHPPSGSCIIDTNEADCFNGKVLRVPLTDTANWAGPGAVVLVSHDPTRKIDSVVVFHDFLAVGGRQDGLGQIWTMDIKSLAESSSTPAPLLRRVVFAEPIYSVEVSSNRMFQQSTFRVEYSSLTQPSTWIDVDPISHAMTTAKQKEVNDYDPSAFVCERLAVEAPDGVIVNVSLVRRKDLDMSQTHPTLLYGYGSYGICIDPDFNMASLTYLKRGVIYCIAHIRGGGENGRLWYEKHGKYLTKRNTFSDFIACAEHLIHKARVTEPGKLAIEGRSAGGLLMGAVMNMRPDLFRVAIAGVPFVDVMTTMCDASIPLTTGEWEEWGNPNEYEFFDYMLSYSPMDNVREQKYPDVLVVAGLHDPRVAYWEPAKWAVRLRKAQQPLAGRGEATGEVLLKMDLDVGHFSASDRYRYLKEKAFEQSYVLSKILPSSVPTTTAASATVA